MVEFDIGLEGMMEKAKRLGDERDALEKENKKRKKRGLAPLPDPQDLKDQDVAIRRPISSAKTMTADEALRRMNMDDEDEEPPPPPPPPKKKAKKAPARPKPEGQPQDDVAQEGVVRVESNEAVRQAEAARRIDDMKHGRINHINNWQQMGVDMGLEGGSETSIFSHSQIREIVGGASNPSSSAGNPNAKGLSDTTSAGSPNAKGLSGVTAPDGPIQKTIEIPMGASHFESPSVEQMLAAFFQDLYSKLGVSFDGLETTLSDLQGRVSEIVSREAYGKPEDYADDSYEQFKETMSGKTKVTYNINGTRISFDAVKVYLEPPCLTIVTREDAAAVKPKPGSKLRISYEFEGFTYDNDLVTFLGTSFAVPELGLRFSGFVRDADAAMLDAEAEA